MKKILLALFIFYAQYCSAQERKEDFINNIVQIKYILSGIDTLPNYHYLVEYTIKIDKESVLGGMKNMSNYIPESIKKELLKNFTIDTVLEKWNCNALINRYRRLGRRGI